MTSLMRTIPLFATAMALTAILAACDNKSVGGNASPTLPPVTVSQPLEKMITEWDEYTGRFTAVETVEIRARVSGFIESVHFKEGQIVKKGDLLFIIDPRPFGIAVEQAKADL
jgi:multidrug efflux system membrane fusion protein